MSRSHPMWALSLLLVAGSLRAGGVAHVTADLPSHVRYHGEFVGTTPLVLSQLPAGDHVVQLEEPRSGRVQRFRFRTTGSAAVEHRIQGRFGAGGAPVAAPAAPVVYQAAPSRLVYAASCPPRYTPVYAPRPRASISLGLFSGRGYGYGYGGRRHHGRSRGFGPRRRGRPHGGLSIGFWR